MSINEVIDVFTAARPGVRTDLDLSVGTFTHLNNTVAYIEYEHEDEPDTVHVATGVITGLQHVNMGQNEIFLLVSSAGLISSRIPLEYSLYIIDVDDVSPSYSKFRSRVVSIDVKG